MVLASVRTGEKGRDAVLMADHIAGRMTADQMRELIEAIYWKCNRHSNCASGPAAHHLADEIVKMVDREVRIARKFN